MTLTKAPAVLSEALGKYDWTQRKLAAAAGVSTKHISRIMTGHVLLTAFTAVKFETVLPPFKAIDALNEQTNELVEQARKLVKKLSSEANAALEQPAMFDIEEVRG